MGDADDVAAGNDGLGRGVGLSPDKLFWEVVSTFLVSICLFSVGIAGTSLLLEVTKIKSAAGTAIAAIPITESIVFVFLSIFDYHLHLLML